MHDGNVVLVVDVLVVVDDVVVEVVVDVVVDDVVVLVVVETGWQTENVFIKPITYCSTRLASIDVTSALTEGVEGVSSTSAFSIWFELKYIKSAVNSRIRCLSFKVTQLSRSTSP